MGRLESLLEKISHNRGQRNSPNWAFMELFKVPNFDRPEEDYLWRLRILQTPIFGVYLHKLCGPDARSILHNHPWAFVSFVLKGSYTENIQCNCDWDGCTYYAVPRNVYRMNVKRFNNSFHWISELSRTPTWTLVFVGRRRRVWGYLDPDGTYTDYNKHENNDSYLKALDARGGGKVECEEIKSFNSL